MGVSARFVLEQGPTWAGVRVAGLTLIKQKLGLAPIPTGSPDLPGPLIHVSYPPRDKALVRTYVRHVGGDAAAYRRRVPAHLFPQWGFGLIGYCLNGTPYPLLRGLNGGCKLVQHSPLPDDEPLQVTAQLLSVDDDGRRAVLTVEIVTSTASAPRAVVAHMIVFVPLEHPRASSGVERGSRPKKEKPRVPPDAREVAFYRIGADAGLDFAKLTGDFNPVHWIPAYARTFFGFPSTILHGFGTMARAIEGLNRGLFAGDVDALRSIEVRFTRPLVLPAKVGVYVRGGELWVGTAPGGPAFLTGRFDARAGLEA